MCPTIPTPAEVRSVVEGYGRGELSLPKVPPRTVKNHLRYAPSLRVGIARPYIHLRKAIAKGGKARRVPLWWDAGTLADLEAWMTQRQQQGDKASDPFVCSQADGSFGNRLGRQACRNRFIVACRCLGADRQRELTIHHGRDLDPPRSTPTARPRTGGPPSPGPLKPR